MSVNRLAIFSTHEYDKEAFLLAMKERSQLVDAPRYELEFIDVQLNENTASMAAGYDAVCIFVNDICNADVVSILEKSGVRLILLRCAGFDNVDLKAAAAANIEVARVSSYSPESVAEHAVTLLLALTRNLITAVSRTTHLDFHLEGLNGYALHHKTVGLIGTGRIGQAAARIFQGFGCRVLGYDAYGVKPGPGYEKIVACDSIDSMLPHCDVVSLHVPLDSKNFHMVSTEFLQKMKRNSYLINTSRGALIDSKALLAAIDSGHLAGAGLDVFEGEHAFVYADHSSDPCGDDGACMELNLLTAHRNVLITGHQAFLTHEALLAIATVTLNNFDAFIEGAVPVTTNGTGNSPWTSPPRLI